MADIVGIAFKLFAMRADLARGAQLTAPMVEDLKNILPELIPLAQRVAREMGVTVEDRICAAYDVFWVQRALNTVRAKLKLDTPLLKVDGDLGPTTQAAVKAYQTRKAIVPDDGIPGELTCAHLRLDV